jgi:hypothetical protein
MKSEKPKDVFDQIEYYLIRVLLLALLLLSAFKLLEREIHGAGINGGVPSLGAQARLNSEACGYGIGTGRNQSDECAQGQAYLALTKD